MSTDYTPEMIRNAFDEILPTYYSGYDASDDMGYSIREHFDSQMDALTREIEASHADELDNDYVSNLILDLCDELADAVEGDGEDYAQSHADSASMWDSDVIETYQDNQSEIDDLISANDLMSSSDDIMDAMRSGAWLYHEQMVRDEFGELSEVIRNELHDEIMEQLK